jgi:hypothetical protein
MHDYRATDGRLTEICRSVYIDQQSTASVCASLFLKAGSTVADAHSDSTDTSINGAEADADRHMHAVVVQPLFDRVTVSSPTWLACWLGHARPWPWRAGAATFPSGDCERQGCACVGVRLVRDMEASRRGSPKAGRRWRPLLLPSILPSPQPPKPPWSNAHHSNSKLGQH